MFLQNSPSASVAFSGYRTSKIMLTSPDPLIINRIEAALLTTIRSLYNLGFRNFITGGASGFDTLAAEAVLYAKSSLPDISLTLALPFLGHDDKFSPHQSAQYHKIIKSADHIIYVSQEFHDQAYLDRNKFMLRNSSTLVCYFDGQRGGTMYTVNRALRLGHKIINLCEGYHIEQSNRQLSLF